MKKQILFTTVFVITFVIMGHADCPNPKWTPTQNVVQLYLDSINNTIPSKGMSLDELNDEREQAVNDLPSEHPDPKLVLPTLIRHLKSDPDEDLRSIIAGNIVRISTDKEVIEALRYAANSTFSKEQTTRLKKNKAYINVTTQRHALMSLAAAHDEESITKTAQWLKENNDDLFGFAGSISIDDKYNENAAGYLNGMLSNNDITGKNRTEVIETIITQLRQKPEKYERYLADILKNGNIEEKGDCLNMLKGINTNWGKSLSDIEGWKKLKEKLMPEIEKMRNKANEKTIQEITGK
jgi:hypothetical protein